MATTTRSERWTVMQDRMAAVLAPDVEQLERLRQAAGGFFQSLSQGKSYSRRPAMKVTIPLRHGAAGGRLVVSPHISELRGDRKTYHVFSDILILALHAESPVPGGRVRLIERMIVRFDGERGAILGRCFPGTIEADAATMGRAVRRFLDDPVGTLAASGEHCVYCGRELTDPESRARGIGPECFEKMGDFLNWVAPAPAVEPAVS